MQGVVFNANYLAYVDDAVDRWVRTALAKSSGLVDDKNLDFHDIGFDFMVKSVALTFHQPVTHGEVLDIECEVARWGRSSFDVLCLGKVGAEERFVANLVYVSVHPGVNSPMETPAMVRKALSSRV